MRTLIIGAGEIGKSLYEVFKYHYDVDIIDKITITSGLLDEYEIMHICFPYSKDFVNQVEEYKKRYNPKYVIIHSTVPCGINEKLGTVSSPTVGIHPHLVESLTTFTKFLGGKDASQVAQYFRRAGIKVYLTDSAHSTELKKIMSTTYYGMCIEYKKEGDLASPDLTAQQILRFTQEDELSKNVICSVRDLTS